MERNKLVGGFSESGRIGHEYIGVIIAGTLNAAESLGVEGKLGTLETGNLADLLVLKDDPFNDTVNIFLKGDA